MRLEIVIQDLLFKKNFVAVPGFGNFHSKYHPARIIKSDHVKFIPPHTIIEFEAAQNANDSSLAEILQSNYNIPFSEAVIKIEEFITETTEKLSENERYSVEGLGEFYYNDTGEIGLRPDSDINFLTDTYGLSSFQVHAIPKEDALDRAIRKHTTLPESSRKKILKGLFVAIPLVFALILIPNILHIPQSASIANFFRNTQVEYDTSNPHKPLPDYASAYFAQSEQSNSAYDTPLGVETPPEPLQQSEILATEETQPESTATIPTAENQPETSIEKEPQFYIIVGSFSTEKNAQRYAHELKKSSHKSGVVIRDNKIRVYIAQADSRDNALLELETIRTNPKFSSAWLYAES